MASTIEEERTYKRIQRYMRWFEWGVKVLPLICMALWMHFETYHWGIVTALSIWVMVWEPTKPEEASDE